MRGLTKETARTFWDSPRRLSVPIERHGRGDEAADWQLLACFAWLHDRFQHLIGVAPVGGSEVDFVPLLRSIDGETETEWPSSPPLQQIDSCQLGSGEQGYVGVGMAGRSHWSIAIEPRGEALCFDVACRLQHRPSPGSLGSTYQRLGEMEPWRVHVRLLTGQGMAAQTVSDESTSGGTERIQPEPLGEVSLPHTVRWSYLVELQRSGG